MVYMRYIGIMDSNAAHQGSIELPASLFPETMWNTHIACLASLMPATQRGLDAADIAGLTGLAFRISLTRTATPAGLYHTVAWEPQWRAWCDALGLDVELNQHQTWRQSYHAWHDRQHALIYQSLERGLPVLYFDNVACGLIMGVTEEGYLVSGVPRDVVHPIWLTHPDAVDFTSRLTDPGAPDTLRAKPAGHDCFKPSVDSQAFLCYTHGVSTYDEELGALESIYRAFMELTGRLNYSRRHFQPFADQLETAFGTPAYNRWGEELQTGRVHHFGTVLMVQSLVESRKLAYTYLTRLPNRVPQTYRGRLEQAAEFFKRVLKYWQQVKLLYAPPIEADRQMTASAWEALRDTLYQVEKTEETCARLLGSVAHELFD